MKHYNALAVSGQCSTGKTTLCEVLSKELGWEHVNVGSDLKNIATRLGLKIEYFGAIPDDILRKIDLYIIERMEIETNVIWDSRLSCYLAQDKPNIFKIYCVADFKIRAERTAKRDNISIREAKKQIIKRDKEEETVFIRLYNLSNPYNEKWTNLLLDTSNNSPEELVNIIMKLLI